MLPALNNHVLFPFRANWKDDPEWSRVWESALSDGITGPESRNALRVQPRVRLSWIVTPRTVGEQNTLDACIRLASKTGKACGPYWGRGCILQNDAAGNLATIKPSLWQWRVDDYIFFLADDALTYEVKVIQAIVGQQLTLKTNLVNTYPAGGFVWPLLFGKFAGDQIEALTSHHGEARIAIQELVSRDTVQLGAVVPPAGQGIGVMTIGTNFVVS